MSDLESWPGPDHAGVAALLDLIQTFENQVDVTLRLLGKDRDQRVYATTFARAAKRMRDYDPKGYWSEPSTAAPTMVASIAQLVDSYG